MVTKTNTNTMDINKAVGVDVVMADMVQDFLAKCLDTDAGELKANATRVG